MKILVFSPHAYYDVHAVPEALVLESLILKGHDVRILQCNGVLNTYCLCMSLIPHDASAYSKQEICAECIRRRAAINNEFGFNSVPLEAFLSANDLSGVSEHVANLSPHDYLNKEYFEIPVARYALYEILLKRKIYRTELKDNEWSEYVKHFKNSMLVLLAARNILSKHKFEALLTYNALYSINHVFCAVAEQNNIRHYSLHAGPNLKHRIAEMTIQKGINSELSKLEHPVLAKCLEESISSEKMAKIKDHVDAYFESKSLWVYSIAPTRISENELRNKFRIKKEQKVLLVTMSSEDERFAAKTVGAISDDVESSLIFKNQREWLEFLIDYAKTNDDYFLLIRVHPRDFPNKREQVTSENAHMLQKLFTELELPKNVAVNWPADNISLHDLIKITDVGLNSRSTAALELLLMGIPVVIYAKENLYSYARELNYCATTIEDYKLKISQAVRDGISLKHSIGAFRWISFLTHYFAIDISDGYKLQSFRKLPRLMARVLYKIEHTFNKKYYLKPVKKRPRPLKNQHLMTVAIEKGLVSHLDALALNTVETGDTTIERNIIASFVRGYADQIAGPEDNLFLGKIEAITNLNQ